MNRRNALQTLITLVALPWLPACSRVSDAGAAAAAAGAKTTSSKIVRLNKPAAAWRDQVSPAAWRVLFEEDTEPSFSSPLDKEKRDGTFVCAACHLPLFDSARKFDSGTGWPSFTQPIAGHIATKKDFKLILPRTEYHCARCGGHQGHVFDDGPPPRGERWCNNGVALVFVPRGQPLPALRS